MYCYLKWFPDHRRAFAKAKFGANPFVSDVLLQLYIDYDSSYQMIDPRRVSPLQLHVDEEGRTVPLIQVFLKYSATQCRVGFENGLCYMQWFIEIGMPNWRAQCYRRALGRFPLLQDVIAVLMRETLDLFVPVSIYRPSRNYGIVHVFSSEKIKKPLYLMIAVSRSFMKKRFLIGGEEDDDVQQYPNTNKVISIPRANVQLSRHMLASCGLNHEEITKQLIKKKFEDPKSEEAVSMMRALAEVTSENLLKPKPVVYVRFNLNTNEQSRLIELYPEVALEFSKTSTHHNHAMAATMRHINLEIMYRNVQYSNQHTVPKTFDASVKEVGGSLRTAVARGWYNTHQCVPVLDIRDNSRRSAE